ncbi:tetratricopeptide repeat protein [Tengunoibacter tsumagoiensis]|uniref:Uncharacterized protein n=1 Tax=Tengunoibacter tsumagoiensis TaxID=2014871 RepID=A0A401ZUT3_9CHLR|nr:tetratricopeptide repeat protein [Tengunoibacter tsumagoiensis]GCE10562.1 hypothetical protein KTT_04210 [Tengunoibacter tsumagoiensis]
MGISQLQNFNGYLLIGLISGLVLFATFMLLIPAFTLLLTIVAQYTRDYRWHILGYSILLAFSRRNTRIYLQRGWAYLQQEDYLHALHDCNRAIMLSPQNGLAYNNRAAVYIKLKEYQKALKDSERFVELQPGIRQSFYNRALAHFYMQEYAAAIKDFDQTLLLDPEYANAYHNRGCAYIGLGNLQAAYQDFVESWLLDPDDISHSWMMEWCKLCLGKQDPEMAEHLEQRAAEDKATVLAMICCGVACWLRESFVEAEQLLEQAIVLASDSEDAHFWLGMTYATLGRDNDAAVAIQQAVRYGLLPGLLQPLQILKEKRPEFFQNYAVTLLQEQTRQDH